MRANKIKIKIFAIVVILCFIALVTSNSHTFVSKAQNDPIIEEIAVYKTWTRINKNPITVKVLLADQNETEDKNVFIVDSQEVTNFRAGDLGG
jgi:hypothetical protein